MKPLPWLLSLFTWGIILNFLRLMVAAYPGFMQSLFAWTSYVLWFFACVIVLNNILNVQRHRHDQPEDADMTHEN